MTRKTTPAPAPASPRVIRQGDVALIQTHAAMPAGCTPVPLDKGRIVLAYGEVTGHAHAIADHTSTHTPAPTIASEAAAEIAEAVIARARLWRAPNGDRYLEVGGPGPVHLTHEEHTQHAIPPGIYRVPAQVEYTPAALRRVAD